MKKKRIWRNLLVLVLIASFVTGHYTPVQAAKAGNDSITLNKYIYTMKKGKTVKLKASVGKSSKRKMVIWSSSNKKVASVSQNGKVTARKNGKAKIIARIKGTKAKSICRIIVGTPVKRIKLNQSSVSLSSGGTFCLKTTISPRNATMKKTAYKSSNSKVAVVNKDGVISAVSSGTANITVTAADGSGRKAVCKVTVKSAESTGTTPQNPDKKPIEEPADLPTEEPSGQPTEKPTVSAPMTKDTTVAEVIGDPAFGDFGRLLFPVDRNVSENMTLEDISSNRVYTWYSNIQVDKTVEIVNDLKTRSEQGEKVFYRIYSEDEMQADSSKRDTGLFFFKGEPGTKFAIMNAGGGFAYVGAMHDSFPHALEASKKGYNAFALIYRPDYAYEDLAKAISYVYDNAEELGVDREGYSLWGGSAGARMAATLGNAAYGPANYGRSNIPQAAAVIMQYTGYTSASADDAPTYACVGTQDGIANYRTMESRLEQLNSFGIPTEFHVYEGLGHGFGLGTGTVAEGWIEDALRFWDTQVKETGATEKNTLLTANPMPEEQQVFYVWEEENVPATTVYTQNNGNYFDDPDFRPYVTTYPVAEGVPIKGAVIICAGGAFQFRSEPEGPPIAEGLSKYGYQCFVLDYRLCPYTQEEGALDLARTVRFVRRHADAYGIDEKDIAVMGFSAGGILAGEMILHYSNTVSPTVLDKSYVPDALDKISADVAADGMIYSFYGRLSVASMDLEALQKGNIPPTYYCYGTNDPFYNQFEAQYSLLEDAGEQVERLVLSGWPHGFGSRGDWMGDYDKFLTKVFENN